MYTKEQEVNKRRSLQSKLHDKGVAAAATAV